MVGGYETEQTAKLTGVVEEVLPNALYRIRLEAGPGTAQGRLVTAGVTSSLRHQTVRLIVGDRVKLKLTTFDPNRGQITEKL